MTIRKDIQLAAAAVCITFAAWLSAGCSAASRHKILSTVFDGVPTPRPERAAGSQAGAQGPGARPQRASFSTHGPYAARLCGACHAVAATNALVAPREELCLHCHELKLDKRYVHGPLASGGCLVCHDPHSSRYRFLLVTESSSFCVNCHDPLAVARIPAHQGTREQCTACHDAHMSDKKYLLR